MANKEIAKYYYTIDVDGKPAVENIGKVEHSMDGVKNAIGELIEALKKAFSSIESESKMTEKSVEKIDDAMEKSKEKSKTFGEIITGALRKVGEVFVDLAIQGIGEFINAIKDGIAEAVDAATQTKILDNALQNIGSTYDDVADSIAGLAQRNIVDDDDIKKMYNFGISQGIAADELERFAQVSLDYAASTGKGVEDSMRRVAAVMKGINEEGIKADESAEKFEELEAKVSGASEAMARIDPAPALS